MSRTESRKGKSAYFVPTISISLVLIVVGMLVFILLNARAVSDHVKRNIGFAVIVKDNTNEVEIKRVQKILDTQPYVYTSKYITKEQAAKSFKKEMGEDFERILGANPLLPSIEIKLNPAYANNDSLAMIEKGLMMVSDLACWISFNSRSSVSRKSPLDALALRWLSSKRSRTSTMVFAASSPTAFSSFFPSSNNSMVNTFVGIMVSDLIWIARWLNCLPDSAWFREGTSRIRHSSTAHRVTIGPHP